MLTCSNSASTFVSQPKIATLTTNAFLSLSIDAIFPTSGLKQVIKENGVKNRFLLSIKLFDGFNEREIEEDKVYKIATVSFIVPGGGDVFKKVLKWYKIRNLKKYGDSKNIMIEDLKNIRKIETQKFIDKENPRFYFK